MRASWEGFALDPVVLFAPEDLMPRAAEIAVETGVIIYDSFFLVLAEDAGTVVIIADGRLLKALEGTAHSASLTPWPTSAASFPMCAEDRGCTATVLQPG